MSRKQKTPDMSNQVRQFTKLFVDTCRKTKNLNDSGFWTSFPDTLNDDVRRNFNFFDLCGFKVDEDWPCGGNGHSVSPKGEISIHWVEGKMNLQLLNEILGNNDVGNYFVDDLPSEKCSFIRIRSHDRNHAGNIVRNGVGHSNIIEAKL